MLGELDKASGLVELVPYLVGAREGQDKFKNKITCDESSVEWVWWESMN